MILLVNKGFFLILYNMVFVLVVIHLIFKYVGSYEVELLKCKQKIIMNMVFWWHSL